MNGKYWWLGLLVLLIVSVGCNPGSNPDVACDPSGCISLGKFAANIFNALQGKVTGEAIMVGGTFPLTGGLARTTADPPSYAMDIQSPINVMSVSKVLTTIGVLQLLAKNNLALGDKISPYLWPSWQKGPNINTITFRDLLTHRAGFRYATVNCNGSVTNFAVLKQVIATGVTMADKATPDYNNCNFAIFRELLPFMEGNTYSGQNDDNARAAWSADFYINYMNQHVFKPLGLGERACKPDPNNVALSYPYPPGSTHGTDWGDWTLLCGGGGWMLSTDDLFYVANDLANGNVLLTNSQKAQMNAPYPDGLGWDSTLRNDCPSPAYVCKNGSFDSGGIEVWTYMGIFKCKVPVVVVVNSPLPPPAPGYYDIIGVVENAYDHAGADGTAGPCSAQPPLPMPPLPLTPVKQPNQPSPTSSPLPFAPVPPVQPILELTPTRLAPIALPILTPSPTATSQVIKPPLQIEPKPTTSPTATPTHTPLVIRPTATHTPSPTPRDTVAPRPPILVAPINGVSVDCGQVSLKWRSAEDPSGIRDYDVELQKQVERTFVAERTWNNTKGDSVDLNPACNTVFRWRARATDNKGNQGNWSDYEEFFVRASIR